MDVYFMYHQKNNDNLNIMPSHLAFSFGFLNNFAYEYWNKFFKLSFGTVFLQDYKYHTDCPQSVYYIFMLNAIRVYKREEPESS